MSVINERTRLNEDEHEEVPLPPTRSTTSRTPLPWRPLLAVLLLGGMQPLAFEIIFPFVNQMILEVGIVKDPERVGFYSGIIESAYACMSFLAILPCSALADRIGRKPVILVGTIGLGASVVFFGMSKSYLGMIFSRCIGGASGAVWACTRIVIAEITDKSNQGLAFSGHVAAYRFGQIIGLPLGGLLAHPERNFALFRTPFWHEYPFLLPCIVAAAFCFAAVILGYFFLQETLKPKTKPVGQTVYGAIGSSPSIDSSSSPAVTSNIDINLSDTAGSNSFKSILTPTIIPLLCSNLSMCLAHEMNFAVFPLYSFTPISSGGLGMNEANIGTQMGIRAVLSILVMLFYPTLERRFGALRVYQLALLTLPLVTLAFPLLNYLARQGGTNDWPFIACFFIFLIIWSIGGIAWTAIAVLTTDAAPSTAALATLNGVSQMTIILPEAIAPGVVTSLFAASIKSNIAQGNVVWIILVVLSSAAAIHGLTLRTPVATWRRV